MSLIVSLRVPDGIVVAGDSLATSQNVVQFIAQDVEVECPGCKQKVTGEELKLPQIPVPFSASSYTQKVFSLYGSMALAYHGQGIVNKRSIYYHVKNFEESHKELDGLVDVKDTLMEYLQRELLDEFPAYRDEAPPNWRPVAFHLNGYETIDGRPVGTTYLVGIGSENTIQKYDDLGCTIGGDIRLIQKIWELGKEDPRRQFRYPLFSLQDSIDLGEFLIQTTSTFQRFANELPTVGGEIDIALLTPFHGFQWIRRKALMERLEVRK